MKLQEKMFAMVEAWHKSGMTRQEFLTGKSVGLPKFDYWVNKYRKSLRPQPSALPSERLAEDFKSFVLQAEPHEPEPQSVSMNIETPEGVRITIYR